MNNALEERFGNGFPERPLVLDGIIFGLQRMGGISNQWRYLLERIDRLPPRFQGELRLPKNVIAINAPLSDSLNVKREFVTNAISRYLPVTDLPSSATFHTSYYRSPARRVTRYITSVYDFTYERYFRGLPRLVHSAQKRKSIMSADISVCISESTQIDLLNHFPSVDPSQTRVVPLGVDRSDFYPEPGSYLDRPYLLFVGARFAYKRFDIALAAMRQLPDLALRVVGPPLSEAERRILEANLPGRWIEHASVPLGELRRLYSDAVAFVFPSDYEGFGLPILEAMACDCPVVASNRSSFPEVAGDAALLAERQDPEEYAYNVASLNDGSLRKSLIDKGRERVAQFDWDRNAKETIALYSQ